jgi:hypothetical protein
VQAIQSIAVLAVGEDGVMIYQAQVSKKKTYNVNTKKKTIYR